MSYPEPGILSGLLVPCMCGVILGLTLAIWVYLHIFGSDWATSWAAWRRPLTDSERAMYQAQLARLERTVCEVKSDNAELSALLEGSLRRFDND